MTPDALVQQLDDGLQNLLQADAAWCSQKLGQARRRIEQGKPATRLLRDIEARMQASTQQAEQRRRDLPQPRYDPALPIVASRDEILRLLDHHPVLIVAGETGSGKTTQLPKFCLDAGRGVRGMIGCTQPRRIAASAMAQRVAEELGSEVGGAVGYQVRFRDRSSPDGYIKFMTDGILLAEITRDPDLDAYDTLIIDEAHERSLNIDFLLGYLKLLLPRRPDLKLLITSATIDTGKFSRHFDGAPVVQVSGRGYPVEVIYQPLDEDGEAPGATGESPSPATDRDLYQGIADAVRRLSAIDPRGDILVFMSGEREIREAGEFLERQRLPHTEILPLYARLSSHEQQRVFHPGPQRRIVLCTNVAETSLTVPRIRFVIDSGLARISRYAHRSRIQRLPIEPISQASANQRSGRCGRLGPGTCIRLYSEADWLGRDTFTEPEILRTSLGSVILRMLVMGLGSVENFPFIDPPAPRMINDGYALLAELNAIDDDRRPTAVGRQMDRWPIDVRLARMLIEGERQDCLEDLLVLVAALSIQDPRERPVTARQAADAAHAQFVDHKSDFAGLLALWRHLRQLRRDHSGNRFRKLCGAAFLNWQRVLEWFDLYQQLRDQAREDGMSLSGRHGDYERVHLALLAGLLSHVGLKHPEDRSYQGARSRSFEIFPGSGLFGRAPKWIMAAEIVETARAWGRINAEIQPQWIERQGAHLLKRHYADPHWSRKRGAVMAWEQVSLFGLVIVERRQVNYAPIDPIESRRIFILEALVRGELDTRAQFMAHNANLRAEVEILEHKRRSRDVLADEAAQFDFFDARVPEDVVGARRFEQWLKQIGPQGREVLHLGYDVLLREDAGQAPAELFPDALEQGGHRFELTYHFEPGHPADGVTLRVPLDLLNTLDARRLQWLVPGLLRDKLIELIRSLPKPLRRVLTPVPAFADALLEALPQHDGEPLLDACAAELNRMAGLDLKPGQLDDSNLPDHLRLRLLVVNEANEEITQGRDVEALQRQLGVRAQRRFMDRQGAGFNRDGVTEWDFGSLAARTVTARGLPAFPALVDQQSAVGLRLFDTAAEAHAAHLDGVLRLLALKNPDKLAYLRRHPGLSREAQVCWTAIGAAGAVVADLVDDLVWSSLYRAAGALEQVRDETAFEAACERIRARIGVECQRQADILNQLLPLLRLLRGALTSGALARHDELRDDVAQQLDDLVYPGFLSELDDGRLAHFPRYLQAVDERIRLLEENPQRDLARLEAVWPWWQRYQQRLAEGAVYDEALDRYRWLLHEYRVSVFAQRLGTAVKVSDKRLAEAWQAVGQP